MRNYSGLSPYISEGVGSGGKGVLAAGGVPAEYFEVAAGFGPGEQGAQKFADAGGLVPLAAVAEVPAQVHIGVEPGAGFGDALGEVLGAVRYRVEGRGFLVVGKGHVPLFAIVFGEAAEAGYFEFGGELAAERVDAAAELGEGHCGTF